MSIVEDLRNGATLVEETETSALAPRVQSVEMSRSDTAREGIGSRIVRFLAALGQNGAMGKNGFMMLDRAVYDEFRVSAQRQQMIQSQ